ncbi:MAG: hypothetical protein J6N19_13510 [Clostridium sp.]|nr:hypothetical protein [Clostridium sp.]
MNGKEFKEKAKEHGVFLWQVALAAGISEPTIIRWLREDLTPEREQTLLDGLRKAKKAQ